MNINLKDAMKNIQNKKKEMNVLINGRPWDKDYNNTKYCENISFENQFGRVQLLRGYFKIENIDLSNEIKIDHLHVEFKQQLIKADELNFDSCQKIIEFYYKDEDKEKLAQIEEYLQKYYPEINSEQKILKLNLMDYENIDLNEVIKQTIQNKQDTILLFGSNSINRDSQLSKKDIYQSNRNNIITDEINHSQNYQNDIQMNEEEINNKNEEELINTDKSTLSLDDDFIKFDDPQALSKVDGFMEKLNKNLVNPYEIPKNESINQNEFNGFSYKIPINFTNNFCITKQNLKKKNIFNYKLIEKSLIFNQDLYTKDHKYLDEYKDVTIINYLNSYNELNQANKNYSKVEFFTDLIIKYVGLLENKKDEIIKRIIDLNRNNNYNKKDEASTRLKNIRIRLIEEIAILKLLKILFLNCFSPFNNEKINYRGELFKNINDEEKIKKMRKKKVTEWLIDFQKEMYKETIKLIKEINKKIVYALVNGQIKDAINLCQGSQNNILALLISQTNNQTKQHYLSLNKEIFYGKNININEDIKLIYNLLCECNKENIEDNIIYDNNFTWIQYFIQIILFSSGPKETLTENINLLDGYLKKIKYLDYENDGLIVPDIKYLLLILYTAIEDNDKELQILIYKSISSSRNLFKFSCTFDPKCQHELGHNPDHHVQFIISDILYKVFNEKYINNNNNINKFMHSSSMIIERENESMSCCNENNNEMQTLYNLNHMMLMKSIEENIEGYSNNSLNSLNYIFALINLSNCKCKYSLKKDICSKFGYDMYNLNDLEVYLQNENNEEDKKLKYFSVGLYCKSKLNYSDATKYFERSEDYGLALSCFTLDNLDKLVKSQGEFEYDGNFLNQFKELIEKFDEKSYVSGIVSIFYKFCNCIINDNIELNYMKDLMTQLLNIQTHETFINLAKGFMIQRLRKAYNLRLENLDSNDDKIYYLPIVSFDILNEPTVHLENKNEEINDGINSLIKMKNAKFFIK